MIYRVVTLHIRAEEALFFEDFFRRQKPAIESFAGCRRVQLLRHTTTAATYYTLSEWDSEADLEAYRQSAFFAETWRITKSLFEEKAGAFSALPIA